MQVGHQAVVPLSGATSVRRVVRDLAEGGMLRRHMQVGHRAVVPLSGATSVRRVVRKRAG